MKFKLSTTEADKIILKKISSLKKNLNIAPLTSTLKAYPMRVNCKVDGKNGQIALDHLRSVDKRRLKSKIEDLDSNTKDQIIETLINMFS